MSNDIKKLNDYQHCKLRTEMYLGSRTTQTQEVISYTDDGPVLKEFTWTPAAFTAFREILDNSLDEIVGHGFGDRIDVEYDESTGIIMVKDNGRGIPIEWNEKEKMHTVTMVLTNSRAGRNFGDRAEVAGTNGIGAAAVNFCSEFFEVTVQRNKNTFKQKYEQGKNDLKINDPSIKVGGSGSGTRIRFKLSREVFKQLDLPQDFIRDRLYEVAVFNPQLKVYFNGEKIKTRQTVEKSLFPNEKVMKFDIEEDGFKSQFYVKPNFHSNGGEYMYSFVNNIPAFNGGSHMDTFRRNFVREAVTILTKMGKKRKLIPNRSDVNEGLLILNQTRMNAPNFDSQSKTRLINDEPNKIVDRAISPEEVAKIIKKNPEWIEEVFKRCAERTFKKDMSEIEKENKKLSRKKIPKLRDATSNNRQDCILLLAEGDSAISGSASVRDPKIHAGLPLRGKVLNVNGEDPKSVIDNKELADIMAAVGLAIGKKAVRENLRYGKIYIAHDMDPDGLNIGALIINFFHTYWPELFADSEKPFVYIFMTPFIIASKGKDRKYWYSDDYHTFDPKEYKGWSITRAKGLGTLEEADWEHSLKTPRLYPIIDDGKMGEALDLIFNGSRADDRKTWMGLH